MKKFMKKSNKGFSLVELIVVIAIMAVLVGVLAPTFTGYVTKSKKATDVQNAQEIAAELAASAANIEGGLATTGTNPTSVGTAWTDVSTTYGVSKNPTVKSLSSAKFQFKYENNTFSVQITDGSNSYVLYPEVASGFMN